MSDERSEWTVRARNAKGEVIEVSGEDLMAFKRCSTKSGLPERNLFLSHLSPLKREVIKLKDKETKPGG